MLNLIIERKKKSWDFKHNPDKEGSFANNCKNNMLDDFVLFDDSAEIFRAKCQSVANYCFGDMAKSMTKEAGDTISEGYFKIKCFVEPRQYKGEIHGIIETKDVDGQWIDRESLQDYGGNEKAGRWLVHSTWSNTRNCEADYAFSAGCLMLRQSDLDAFNNILHAYNVAKGDIIPGEIVEEEDAV